MKKNYKINIILLLILNFCIALPINKQVSSVNHPDLYIQALDKNNLINKNIGWIVCHGEDDNSTYSVTVNDLKAFGADFSLINNTVITSTLLNSYNILVIEEGGTNWGTNELIALNSWIEGGGALYILGDEPGHSQGNVSQYFDVYYNDTVSSAGALTILNTSHLLFENVSIIYSYGSTASIDASQSTNALDILAVTDEGGLIIVTLLIKSGRILWIVDSDGMINDFAISSDDNRQLANNSWIWLATPNPYIPDGGGGDNIIIIIIIISSIVGAAIIISVIIIIRRRK